MRKGPGRALECPVDADTWASGRLGPGNTNVRVRWLGGYYTSPQYPPTAPTPGTPLPSAPAVSITVHPVTAATCSLGSDKEILGVDNAP